jgi:hypothetical protein
MTTVQEGGKNYSVAFRGGEVPNDGVPLINNPRHPTVVENTRMTLKRLKALTPPDRFLHNHHQNLERPLHAALPVDSHCDTCMDAKAFTVMLAGQKRTSQNRSARQKRRNSVHQGPFYFGANITLRGT